MLDCFELISECSDAWDGGAVVESPSGETASLSVMEKVVFRIVSKFMRDTEVHILQRPCLRFKRYLCLKKYKP